MSTSPSSASDSYSPELAMLGAILVFGINYPVLKGVVGSVSTFAFNGLRFAASILVLEFLFHRRLRGSFSSLGENWVSLTVLAFVGYFVSPCLLVYGLQFTTAANAALILAGAPVWTALLSWVLRFDRLGFYAWTGLSLSTVGMILVALPLAPAGDPGRSTLYGDLLLVLDCIVWGSYVALQKYLLDRLDPLESGFWSLVIVLPVYALLSLAFPINSGVGSLSWGRWAGIVFSGVFAMGFARVWWNVGLRSLGPTTTSIYGNGIPVVSVVLGWLLLGEPITVPVLVGGMTILLGAWMARRDRIARGGRRINLPEG